MKSKVIRELADTKEQKKVKCNLGLLISPSSGTTITTLTYKQRKKVGDSADITCHFILNTIDLKPNYLKESLELSVDTRENVSSWNRILKGPSSQTQPINRSQPAAGCLGSPAIITQLNFSS